MADRQGKKPVAKKPSRNKRREKKPLPGFFSDYGGSGIRVDWMPGMKKAKK